MPVAAVDLSPPAVPPREAAPATDAGRQPGVAGGEERGAFATALGDARATRGAADRGEEERVRPQDHGRARLGSEGTRDRPGASPVRDRDGVAGPREETASGPSGRAEKRESAGRRIGTGDRAGARDRARREAREEEPPAGIAEGEEATRHSHPHAEPVNPAVRGDGVTGHANVPLADIETVADIAALPPEGQATGDGVHDTVPSDVSKKAAPASSERSLPLEMPGPTVARVAAPEREVRSVEAGLETRLPAAAGRAVAPVSERGGGPEDRATDGEVPPAPDGRVRESVTEADAPAAEPGPRGGPARERGPLETTGRPEGVARPVSPEKENGEKASVTAETAARGGGGAVPETGATPAAVREGPAVRRVPETGFRAVEDAEGGDVNGDAESGAGGAHEGAQVAGGFEEGFEADVAGGGRQSRPGADVGPGAPRAERGAPGNGDVRAGRGGNGAPATGATVADSGTPSHGAQSQQGPDAARPATAGSILRAEQALAADIERGAITRVRDGGEMRLALRPTGLGEVELRLAVRDGGVHAHLATAHEETRQLLAGHRHELETALQRYQLRLESFDVDLGGHEGRPSLERDPEPAVASPGTDRPGPGPAVTETADMAAAAARFEAGRGTLSIRV